MISKIRQHMHKVHISKETGIARANLIGGCVWTDVSEALYVALSAPVGSF